MKVFHPNRTKLSENLTNIVLKLKISTINVQRYDAWAFLVNIFNCTYVSDEKNLSESHTLFYAATYLKKKHSNILKI